MPKFRGCAGLAPSDSVNIRDLQRTFHTAGFRDERDFEDALIRINHRVVVQSRRCGCNSCNKETPDAAHRRFPVAPVEGLGFELAELDALEATHVHVDLIRV